MKNYFCYFLLLQFFTSCFNNLPEATIRNIQVNSLKTQHTDQLVLYFTSDIDLDSLYKNATAPMSIKLYCPLDGTVDFDLEKMFKKKYFINGYLDIDTTKTIKNNYITKFNISEGDTINGSSDRLLKKEEIIDLLKNKECIPCKVYTTFYFTGREPYFSKQFCIPAQDVIKALE